MSQFLLRVCKGNTDDEMEVEMLYAEGLTFEDRIAHAKAQAQAACEHAIDVATANDAEAGVSHTHMMREELHSRFVHSCDGVDIMNYQAVIG